jgi:peptidyl-prolyl cis-trans isomerase NIMA-interacting 1
MSVNKLALIMTILIAGVTACGGETESEEPDGVSDVTALTAENTRVIERPDLVFASHILIPFQGCMQAPEDALTREEARAFLTSIADSIANGDITFEEAAARHSTCPSSQNGGSLGGFTRGQMVPEFENVAFALAPGEVSEVFETSYGFHIVLRQPTISASHILIAWQGAERSSATRSQDEALELIESIQEDIASGEITFADAAAQYSDCPSSSDGGDLGPFPRNVMHPAFEEAAFSLEPGDISGVVETSFGYHLIMRTE